MPVTGPFRERLAGELSPELMKVVDSLFSWPLKGHESFGRSFMNTGVSEKSGKALIAAYPVRNDEGRGVDPVALYEATGIVLGPMIGAFLPKRKRAGASRKNSRDLRSPQAMARIVGLGLDVRAHELVIIRVSSLTAFSSTGRLGHITRPGDPEHAYFEGSVAYVAAAKELENVKDELGYGRASGPTDDPAVAFAPWVRVKRVAPELFIKQKRADITRVRREMSEELGRPLHVSFKNDQGIMLTLRPVVLETIEGPHGDDGKGGPVLYLGPIVGKYAGARIRKGGATKYYTEKTMGMFRQVVLAWDYTTHDLVFINRRSIYWGTNHPEAWTGRSIIRRGTKDFADFSLSPAYEYAYRLMKDEIVRHHCDEDGNWLLDL